MPRGPSSNPIVKRIPWQQRPTCAECGLKIRRPRPGDEKVCSRCHELLHVSEFPHNSARADHRETYCRPCKRVRQNEGNRRIRGAAQPLSDLSPVGEETTTLIGTFVSQAPLTEYREVPSSVKPVQVQYETVDRKPVYELTLKPTHRPAGTAADNIAIVHTFTELAAAPLEAGQWLARVFQDGQLEKVLRAGDQWPIVDTSIEFTEDEDAPLVRGSAATHRPVRGASDWPWSSSSSQTEEFIVGETPITGMVRSPPGTAARSARATRAR